MSVIGPTLQLWIAHHNLPFLRLNKCFHILYLLGRVLNQLQQPAILLKQLKLFSLNGVVFVEDAVKHLLELCGAVMLIE